MNGESTHEVVQRLMGNRQAFSTREVAQQARVSRQAAQKLLRALVDSGALTIQGKARAARYCRVDDSAVVDSGQVDDSSGFRRAAQLADFGSPYAVLPFTGVQPELRRTVLDVDSAGSLYRLSARMLLCDVAADEVQLDFTGVMDVGEEFLHEVFGVWGKAHPRVRLVPVNVPPALAALVDAATP